ncbi:MAG: hypothetical protein ABI333_25315 [bacterium]
MANSQRRRSISVRGEVYDRVKKFCDVKGISMSAFVEDRILEHLGGGPISSDKGSSKAEIAQHFTF